MFGILKAKGATPLLAVVGLALVAGILQPTSAYAGTVGSAKFTDGGYASASTSYRYYIELGPRNTCGTLHVRRNGGPDEVTPGWVCTDPSGFAEKGPWTPTQDETATDIYIQWPNNDVTNSLRHINDVTPPAIYPNGGGSGVQVPSTFTGTATDAQWGSGFNHSYYNLYATFRDNTTGMYYNGTCYCSFSGIRFYATIDPPTVGAKSVNWAIPAPPSGTHYRTHTYTWSAQIKDRFYWAYGSVNYNYPSNGQN